jgi:hypothetical protein
MHTLDNEGEEQEEQNSIKTTIAKNSFLPITVNKNSAL